MNINDENLLEGMEKIFHNGPTDISDTVASIRIEPRKAEPQRMEAPAPTIFSKEESRRLWQPVKPDPDDVTRVKNAAKWSVLFGSLCFLFFYWQQTGLMAPAAAVPSMLTCMLCAGVSVGKNLTK